MEDEGMPRIGGVNKWEAEAALDTLIRAKQIESDEKLMGAVGIVAEQKAEAATRVAQQFSESGAPLTQGAHPGRVREGRTEF